MCVWCVCLCVWYCEWGKRVAEYGEYKARVLSGQDEGFGQLMTKLEAALAGERAIKILYSAVGFP